MRVLAVLIFLLTGEASAEYCNDKGIVPARSVWTGSHFEDTAERYYLITFEHDDGGDFEVWREVTRQVYVEAIVCPGDPEQWGG